MKKQHDAAGLANELEGASAFFQARQSDVQQEPGAAPTSEGHSMPRPITRPSDTSTTPPADAVTERAATRPVPRPKGRPMQRSLQRRSFEFYVDQLETLKGWSLQAQLQGEKTSMSEMIRAALDRYLRDEAGHHPSPDDPTTRPSDASAGDTDA